MSTKTDKEKQYQFLKLCIALTKQGFRFTRLSGYRLQFEANERKRLFHPQTKLPFVDGILIYENEITGFKQWAQ